MTKKLDEAELFDVGEIAKILPLDDAVKQQVHQLGRKAADMFSGKIFDMARTIMKNKASSVNYDYDNVEELEGSEDFYDLVYELSDHFLSGMNDSWMFSFKDQ